MKRSKLDILLHKREVLFRKIKAYERVREALRGLADELKDDPYALEALNGIDNTVFNQLQMMYLGLKRLETSIKALERSALQ